MSLRSVVGYNKDKFTRAGFEPMTSRLTCQRFTYRATALCWQSPYFVNISIYPVSFLCGLLFEIFEMLLKERRDAK